MLISTFYFYTYPYILIFTLTVWFMREMYLLHLKERIVPPDPITSSERRSTLLRLNQVIQHRLVTGNLLPQMRNLKVPESQHVFKL
jgi:hypothetical protein